MGLTESTRVNISLPADWLEAFREQADADGKTVSEFVRDAARRQLSPEKRKALSTPEPRGRRW